MNDFQNNTPFQPLDDNPQQASGVENQQQNYENNPQQGFQNNPQQNFQSNPQQGFQNNPQQDFQSNSQQWFQNNPQQGFQGGTYPSPENKPKKSKGALKVFIIIGAILIVLGACTAFFWSHLTNTFAKLTSTPKEYYAQIETSNIEETTEFLYAMFEGLTDTSNEAYQYSYKVDLGDGISEISSLVLGQNTDIEWIKSIEFSGEGNYSKYQSDFTLKGSLNNKEIFDSTIAFDENKNLYVGLPIITADKYIKFTNQNNKNIDYNFNDFFPEKELFQKLARDYFKTIIDNAGDAQMTSEKLCVGEISQRATLITFEIDEVEFYTTLIAVLEKVLDDDELERIIDNYSEIYEEMYSVEMDFYDVFETSVTESMDSLRTELKYAKKKSEEKLKSEEVIYKVWVNSKGEIIAKELNIKESGSQLFVGSAKKGSSIATEFYLKSEGKKIFEVEGKSKAKFTNISGNYKISADNKEILNIDIENVNLVNLAKDENFEGKIKLKAGEKLIKFISEYIKIDRNVSDLINNGEIVITSEKDAVAIEFLTDKKSCFKVTTKITEKAYSEKNIPFDKAINYDDEDALIEMIENFDIDVLSTRLLEANVPADITNSILNESNKSAILDLIEQYKLEKDLNILQEVYVSLDFVLMDESFSEITTDNIETYYTIEGITLKDLKNSTIGIFSSLKTRLFSGAYGLPTSYATNQVFTSKAAKDALIKIYIDDTGRVAVAAVDSKGNVILSDGYPLFIAYDYDYEEISSFDCFRQIAW